MATEQHSKQEPEMCYVARASCGRVVRVVMDDPRFKKDTAASVGDMIRHGYDPERLPLDEYLAIGLCKCPRVKGKLQHVTAEASA